MNDKLWAKTETFNLARSVASNSTSDAIQNKQHIFRGFLYYSVYLCTFTSNKASLMVALGLATRCIWRICGEHYVLIYSMKDFQEFL